MTGSNAFLGGLKPMRLQLAGSAGDPPPGVGQDVPLVVGRRYELRCSAVVYVRPGQGSQPLPNDIQVLPEAPLTFTADVNGLSVAAGSADAFVWIREQPGDEELGGAAGALASIGGCQ